uniref:CACN subunit beta associated regulatory protein n=1 Tax=Lepisosteus oculatus TaxID=7918 RepID=W5MCI4_LEPOC
ISEARTSLSAIPSQDVPKDTGKQDGYVLLLVLLSIFIGGTLVLLSGLLVICRRCCEGDRRYSRASDDPEKTNTTYLEDLQPTQEITIKVDESDCLSSSSCHDNETERFLSTAATGRRVSFNEASLFDQGRKTQEKGRRYTLTEGDFHHLKNARLTHLHLPPPTLKIVTIHECESSENTIATATRPASRSSLSIFQPSVCPLPQTALTSLAVSPSSALPGDALNSVVDTSFTEKPPSPRADNEGGRLGIFPRAHLCTKDSELLPFCSCTAPDHSNLLPLPVACELCFRCSLESASVSVQKHLWEFLASGLSCWLDDQGSPKRRQFQRQRAASESMDQEEHEAHHIDIIQYIARTHNVAYRPPSAGAGLLPPSSSPPPSLGRLETVEVVLEAGTGVMAPPLAPPQGEEGAGCGREGSEHQTIYRDIWTLRASLEQYASSDQSSNNDRDSVRSDADSVCSLGGGGDRGGLPSYPSQDIEDELEAELEPGAEREGGAKQGSVDSERGSDGEAGNRKLLQMDSGYASIEAPPRAPEELRLFGSAGAGGKDKTASEKRRFFTSAGRKGTVCESFEERLFDEELEEESAGSGAEQESPLGWSPYGRMFGAQSPPPPPPLPPPLPRRDYSIDEKTDALFHEFLRHDPQFDQPDSPLRAKHRSRAHLRKAWQRAKQYSDPGVRFPPAFERHRTPLRRGDSVNCPLDARYHGTLPRIV